MPVAAGTWLSAGTLHDYRILHIKLHLKLCCDAVGLYGSWHVGMFQGADACLHRIVHQNAPEAALHCCRWWACMAAGIWVGCRWACPVQCGCASAPPPLSPSPRSCPSRSAPHPAPEVHCPKGQGSALSIGTGSVLDPVPNLHCPMGSWTHDRPWKMAQSYCCSRWGLDHLLTASSARHWVWLGC